MNWRSAVTVAVVVGAMGFAAGRVWSQDDKPKMPSPEDIEKMMVEMAKPAKRAEEVVGMG